MDDDVLDEEGRVAALASGARGNQGDDQEARVIGIDVEDEEAQGQKKTVMSGLQDVITVKDFQKVYKRYCCSSPVKAVGGVSFGLDYGECFALLGVNGAGKSTTFKSLTRDIAPTKGEIKIQGYDVQKEFTKARKLIGYCPQHDAIFPLMTVEEHLWYYARVKGIHPERRMAAIEKAIHDLNLTDYRNKPAGTLSGGNKRKLSVAMALIGNPPIILLDEPSAGMDP